MSIDAYKTRDMLKVLEQTHEPGDFLLSTFVSEVEVHDTDTVDIDIVRHGKKMAPFVSPVREGMIVTHQGFETRTIKIPYTKMKSPITAQHALSRRPGMTVYNGQTAKSMADEIAGKKITELDQMIFRLEEKMAAEALQTGKVVVSGEGIGYEIDFGMKATHLPTLLTTAIWDESTAEIQSDLKGWADLVYRDSGLNATDCIMGATAASTFLNSSDIGTALDRRRIDRGEILVERLPKGVIYYGFDRESGLNIWGYNEQWYDEANAVMKPLIDDKKVVVLSRGMRFTRHYGAIQNVEVDFMGPRYPSSWVTKDPSALWVMLESAPLLALHQPDAVVCATVLD
jgi:hypothetical protein